MLINRPNPSGEKQMGVCVCVLGRRLDATPYEVDM